MSEKIRRAETLLDVVALTMPSLADEIRVGLNELKARVALGQDASKYGKVDDEGKAWVEALPVHQALFGNDPEHPDTARVRRALSVPHLHSRADEVRMIRKELES